MDRLSMHHWSELTSTALEDLDPADTVAVLPVAAIEQHGPHLPLGTDAIILEGILDRVTDSGQNWLRLPLQAVGNSLEHLAFPGTLSQSPETLLTHWTDLGRGVRRAGIRKLAIVNSHGGQPQLVDLVAQRLRAEEGMLAARVQTFALGVPPGLFPSDELRFGMHGGEVETSMMLALRPELVSMEAARHFRSAAESMADEFELLGAEEPVGFAWQAQDLNAVGVTGNAAAADHERGEQLLTYLAERLGAVLRDMTRFPMERLGESPT